MSCTDIKTLNLQLNMQQQLIQRFINQRLGKSDDLGPKTSVFGDLRKNKIGKRLDMIYRVMRDSHVEFQ